jgi:hypothetical protein
MDGIKMKMSDHCVVNTVTLSRRRKFLLQVIWMSPGWISRVTLDLAAQQNEDAGPYGKECQNNTQAAHRHERRQAREN